jgi:hypothetical protein
MWRLPLVAALFVAGCGAKIGDSCRSNIDCSPLGDRFCDTAPVEGYCTEEDCGPTSCPSEAVCIRFFEPLADVSCLTGNSSSTALGRGTCTDINDRCVCDVTDSDGNCICAMTDDTTGQCVSNGHCAPSSTERHWCERSCSSDSDCRTGYECRRTGTFGAEPIPTFDEPVGKPAKFCAPKPAQF